MGRYSEAADAFTRAMRLLGENPDRLAGVAESQVFANDGIVNETARVAYVRLQQIMPDRIEPRFWLAVAAEQDGRFEEAAAAFEKMLIEGEASAPWRSTVVERWRAVRTRLGLATDPVPQRAPDVVPAGKVPAIAKDDADAIRAMPADAQKQMIEQMVAGLDQRLSEDGRDLAGWQRLIRAYTVLGRRDDALAALARARAALAQETQSLEALGELAKSLGLAS
jgi:cytochrome c-type biogenesis protein CcmH